MLDQYNCLVYSNLYALAIPQVFFLNNAILIPQVLLGLLEMCCEADWWVPSSKYGLPLTAAGDSCRTSRLALTSIARVRPAVFITSISKEIARYNNLGNFTIFTILQFHELFSNYTRVARVDVR